MAQAKKKVEVEEEIIIEPPVIKVKDCVVESAGVTQKHLIVNLPSDFTLQDVNDAPQLWKAVQSDRGGIPSRALCEYDTVEMRSATWTCFARVSHADAEGVTFYDVKKASKPKRDLTLFSDKTFEVRWSADGFTYHRKSDGVRMGVATYPTAASCKAALMREQYPARIA